MSVGLILEGSVQYSTSGRTTSPFYLTLPKAKLSIPYQVSIVSNALAKATLLEVRPLARTPDEAEQKAIRSIEGKKFEFSLDIFPIGSYDYLYFTQASWNTIRDTGLITPDYIFKFRLETLRIQDQPPLPIYPTRDII